MVDVILPVLNEVGAIPVVLASLPDGYDAVIVDNGSSDGSAEVARDLGARVVPEPARGFGAACWSGLRAATSDVVCFMDCDGSLCGEDLPAVSSPVLAGEADLVLGARRAGRASPVHALAANRFLAWEVRRRTGLQVRDLGPMRAARRESLLALDLRDRRYGWPLEMVLTAVAHGWRIREVPVRYEPRIGKSKVTGTVGGTLRTVRDMARVLR
jgi:glycosyltransferase involved in cell wall biosynthesis